MNDDTMSDGGNKATNLNINMHANIDYINNYKNREYGTFSGGREKDCECKIGEREVRLLEQEQEEEITWSQVFNMMYTDAKEIISPLSKIIDYVAPDPNEEDSRLAKMEFEEKISGKIKKPIMKYKIGTPDTMHIIDENSIHSTEAFCVKDRMVAKKRGLIGTLKEESVKDAIEILKSANNNSEKKSGTVWDEERFGEKRDITSNIHSPETKLTPSTCYNTDSSPNSVVSTKEEEFKSKETGNNKIYNRKESDIAVKNREYEQINGEDVDCWSDSRDEKNKSSKLRVVIPRLSLPETSTQKSNSKVTLSGNDSLSKDDTVFEGIVKTADRKAGNNLRKGSYTDRLTECSSYGDSHSDSEKALFRNADRNHSKTYKIRDSNRTANRNGCSTASYYHSHAYTMENISNTIQRPISRSNEEILNLYSREELEKIKIFVRKSNDLVYEGPLEKKNSWSWGYKLRWVRISNCEMHYFLSPKESKIKGKSPLGVINFKVAEWSLKLSSTDNKSFTIVSYGNNRNGRGYQWRVPINSEQTRKSWTNRIEKIIKATAFMQQLKGVLKFSI